jgi:hypothetical protein
MGQYGGTASSRLRALCGGPQSVHWDTRITAYDTSYRLCSDRPSVRPSIGAICNTPPCGSCGIGEGAAALLEAIPAERPAGLRPLWLRLEWNVINVGLLQQGLDEQRRSRGLISDVPEVEAASASAAGGGGGVPQAAGPHLHDHKLVLSRGGSAAAVRLPWVACQKQPPSEAGVLREVKGFYSR